MPTTQCGTLVVVPQFSESNIDASCNLADSTIVANGGTTDVRLSFANNQQRAAEIDYTVRLGGSDVQSDTLPNVGGNEGRNLLIGVGGLSAGNYNVEVEWNAQPASGPGS
jgi:hypothetical protein